MIGDHHHCRGCRTSLILVSDPSRNPLSLYESLAVTPSASDRGVPGTQRQCDVLEAGRLYHSPLQFLHSDAWRHGALRHPLSISRRMPVPLTRDLLQFNLLAAGSAAQVGRLHAGRPLPSGQPRVDQGPLQPVQQRPGLRRLRDQRLVQAPLSLLLRRAGSDDRLLLQRRGPGQGRRVERDLLRQDVRREPRLRDPGLQQPRPPLARAIRHAVRHLGPDGRCDSNFHAGGDSNFHAGGGADFHAAASF
jgi:hypothetical protein